MDKHFLEFWGNFLLSAAKSQKQLDDMAQWMQQGLKGFENYTALFRKIYGLENTGEGSPAYLDMWKKAEGEFRKSFVDYLNMFGCVPKEQHLELVKKYEQLKEKSASQQETIRHLKMLLSGGKAPDESGVARQFQELIKRQNEQFQKLMENMSQSFKSDQQAEDRKDSPEGMPGE